MQYKTGTASTTNGSAIVTGSGTVWLASVTAGDSFTIAGTGVVYDVASVNSNTSITLSVAYAGATASGAVYAIGTSFTVPDNFPEMSQGDIETATIFTRAMRKIQGKFSGVASGTTAEIGQAFDDHVALVDPHSQYAELSGGTSANFAAMPQVGGDPIVESGSNADGEWTRWSDGTQLCTDRPSLAYSPTTAAGVLYKTTESLSISYPVAFRSGQGPSVVVYIHQDVLSPFGLGWASSAIRPGEPSPTGTSVNAWADSNNFTFGIGYSAAGRWK